MGRARKPWLQWYRTDIDLYDHPKTIELASAAKWDREIAIARIHRLWSWIARRCPAGEAVGLEASGLEQHMREMQWHRSIVHDYFSTNEDPAKDSPWDLDHLALEHGALHPFVVAGFLEPITGGYRVHDWFEMNGRQLREAERSAERAESRKVRRTAIRPRENRGRTAATVTVTETVTVTDSKEEKQKTARSRENVNGKPETAIERIQRDAEQAASSPRLTPDEINAMLTKATKGTDAH